LVGEVDHNKAECIASLPQNRYRNSADHQ
jgi:hypothetical protein